MSFQLEWELVSSQGIQIVQRLQINVVLIIRLSFVTCPMELVKVQLQNQTQSSAATALKGPIDCLKKMYSVGGIRYCFKGMVPTALRELSFGPYFLTYEVICRGLTPTNTPNYELSGPKVILAGGAAGIVAWCSTYFAGNCKIAY